MFKPLADWKVWLLSIGIVEERSKQLLCGWWVVGRKNDWTTRPTQCRVLYQKKSGSIVTNWSCCHPSTSCHRLCHQLTRPEYNLPLDWSNHVSRFFVRWVSHSFIIWSPLLCFIILSPTLCHMPLCLLIVRPLIFSWWTFPFVLLNHLFSWPTSFLDQPTNHGLAAVLSLKWSKLWSCFTSQTPDRLLSLLTRSLMPLFLYCCVIYRLHVCGVLSWPRFCISTALSRCGWAP